MMQILQAIDDSFALHVASAVREKLQFYLEVTKKNEIAE